MDILSSMSSPEPNTWFSQLDVEDTMLLQEFVGDCLVDFPQEDMPTTLINNNEDFHHSISSSSESNSSTATAEVSNTNSKRRKLQSPNTSWPNKPNKTLSFTISPNTSRPNKPNSNNNNNVESTPVQQVAGSGLNEGQDHKRTTTSKKKPKRVPDQSHNHIIAERQRRQTISQRFIALSALIPGLKKMDKTSILGEAINHMKQLKERLKMMEEENGRREVESIVVVKRSQVNIVEKESSYSSTSSRNNDHRPATTSKAAATDQQLPEIEARFSNYNKCALIKVHCHMQKGILVKLLTEIEKLHLSVTNINALPFNATNFDITIMAQMEPEFEMTPQDVIKDLRSIFH